MPFMSDKFPRIMHFTFSPNAQNDDRIAGADWFKFLCGKKLMLTEKIDGECSAIKKDGVFARTHAVPNHNPWANFLWPIYDTISSELGDLEIFGENMYAIHSIEYERLNSYFYVFAVRERGIWKSWDETKFIAEYFGFQCVPVYTTDTELINNTLNLTDRQLEATVEEVSRKSNLGSICEGCVVRVADEFPDPGDSTMGYKMLKYVRKNHVQTNEHWTRNWKKAKLYGFNIEGLNKKSENFNISR
jgi:RNA ligase